MNWKRSVKYLLIGVGIMASSTTALHLASRTFIADEAGAMKRLPVLFIHGLDSSKHTWRDVNKLLQGQGYDSVSVDLRGWGSSPLGKSDIEKSSIPYLLLTQYTRVYIL